MVRETVLFPGKFNPFHEGHLAIIDTLVEEGKDVMVLVKRQMTYKEFSTLLEFLVERYGKRTWLALDTPFGDIVHGRDTNYKFRRVKLPKELEGVSSTKIRKGEI